jgi:Phage terminase large subunit
MKRIVDNGKLPPTPKAELDKYYSRRFNLTQFLFDRQLAFVEDPAPFKVAVCSRRAGKTVSCVAHLIHTAISTPDVVCLYITLSADQAKRNVWREVKKINEKFKLEGKLNEIDLSIMFQNGSIVYLSGAKDASQIEKFRGLAIKLCYIDECQSFREYIKDLIDDIIAPALLDYAGTLCLIGTPGPVPAGYFYDCAVVNANWSKHAWTFWDNPFIPVTAGMSHKQVFDRELKRKGGTLEDPSTQREFFGKWILDADSLLIKYNKDKNHFQTVLPNITYHYIMGIDIGFKDADAICILAYSDNDPVTYLVEELITTKQGITELVEQIQYLDKKYKVNKMVMDMGGLGKKIGEELIKRHSIPVEAADKARKMENIELLNDALRSKRFMAKSASRFAQDSYLVEIDRDKSTPEKIKVSDRFHSDIIDAVLYAFKFSPAYSYQAPVKKLIPGTKEWADAQDDKMWNLELEGYIKAEELAKYENGEN